MRIQADELSMIILTHNYPSKDNPMAGAFIDDHVREMIEEGRDNPKVVHLPYGEKMTLSPGKVLKLLGYLFRAVFRVKKLAQSDSDKVVAHWWIPLGWLAAKYFTGSVYVVCHGTDLLFCHKHRLFASLLSRYARRVDHWQCVSAHMSGLLRNMYPFIAESDITVRPMPVAKLFRNRGRKRRKNHFLSVGPLIEEKGHKEAARWLAKNVTGAHLLVVGDGDARYKSELLEIGKQSQVEIEFYPPVSRERLAELFNSCEGLLTFSRHEGYGLVCREAKACGCKVIGYVGDGRTEECVDVIVTREN